MPFATLGNTTAYLFFSHAALENKYEMLPTYCPRDELKFIPRAEFAISYLSSMRLGKKTKKPCYFPGAKYTFSGIFANTPTNTMYEYMLRLKKIEERKV